MGRRKHVPDWEDKFNEDYFRDKIDYPVSPLWRRHYAEQGLTYDISYPEELEELESKVKRLERMNEELMQIVTRLLKSEVKEEKELLSQKEKALRRF